MDRDSIIVFTRESANELLSKGYSLLEIKRDKNDPSGRTSLFVFKNENSIRDELRAMAHR